MNEFKSLVRLIWFLVILWWILFVVHKVTIRNTISESKILEREAKKEARELNEQEKVNNQELNSEKKADIVAMMKNKQDQRVDWQNWDETGLSGSTDQSSSTNTADEMDWSYDSSWLWRIFDDRVIVPPSDKKKVDSVNVDWDTLDIIDPPLPDMEDNVKNNEPIQWDNLWNNSQNTDLQAPKEDSIESEEKKEDEQNDDLTSKILPVPFWSQAPEKNREQPRQDACEEASIIQAAHYIKWVPLSPEKMKEEILKLVDIQNTLFWDYIDTTIEQTKELYLAYYWSWDYVSILDNPTREDMKNEIKKWRTIVTPLAWKLLKNKYYTDWGPRYHMLTVIGYDESWFITNDVWTRRGEKYHYPYERFMHAIHDFVPVGNILSWEKKVLVLWRE